MPTPESLVEIPEEDLRLVWENVERDFENESAHQAFLELCAERQDLACAARCYRTVIEDAQHRGLETRGRVASAQLEKIATLAWSMMKNTAQPPPEFRKVTTWIGACLCLILLLAMAFAFRG